MSYVLEAGLSRDYYTDRIRHIEQDLRDLETGVFAVYRSKSHLINDWAATLEAMGDVPTDAICSTIVNRLIELQLTSGISWVYKSLPDKYKNTERSELTKLGNSLVIEDYSDLDNSTLYKPLPFQGIDLDHASHDKMQANEDHLRQLSREVRRRHNDYVQKMHERGIPIAEDSGDQSPISTPTPYTPKKGHLWKATTETAIEVKKLWDTYSQVTENIEAYPPRADGHETRDDCACETCEAEDLKLSEGMSLWTFYFAALREYMRPLADKKFAQSHMHWQRTEIMNSEHGKHAAAVLSKKTTYEGKTRALTREQVGDKQYDIYSKSVRFAAVLELTNYLVVTLPDRWRERIMGINIADRRNMVGPILSEGAFGSDKKNK